MKGAGLVMIVDTSWHIMRHPVSQSSSNITSTPPPDCPNFEAYFGMRGHGILMVWTSLDHVSNFILFYFHKLLHLFHYHHFLMILIIIMVVNESEGKTRKGQGCLPISFTHAHFHFPSLHHAHPDSTTFYPSGPFAFQILMLYLLVL